MNTKSKAMGTNLILLATLLMGMSNAGASTHSYKYLPGVVPVLGQGFLVSDPTALPAPCMTGMLPVPNSDQNVNQSAPLEEEVVTSSSALKAALGIDMQMDASVLVYSGSGELNIDTDYSRNEDDVSIVIQGRADYGNEVLDLSKMVYRPDIQKLLNQGRIADFRKACGDELVTTLNRGTSVAIVITLKDVDSTFKESITSNASASGGIGPLSGSAKSKINQMLTTQNGSSSISINVFVRGGNGLPDFEGLVSGLQSTGKSWEQLEQGIGEIFKKLTPDKAAITGFVTESYPGVNDNDENLVNEQKTQALVSLVSVYRFQVVRQKLIEDLFQREEQTGSTPAEFSDIASFVLDAGKADLPSLDKYVNDVAKAHQSCLQDQTPDLQSCKMPVVPYLASISFLYRLLTL